MPTLSQQLAADLAAAVADYGQTVEWAGTTYKCVRRTGSAGLDFQPGGEVDKKTETLVIARSAFSGALPQIGDAIDSDTLQIKDINPARFNLEITVGSFDSGN